MRVQTDAKLLGRIAPDVAKVRAYWPESDWPDGAPVVSVFDKSVWLSVFDDHERYAAELAAVVMQRDEADHGLIH